MRLTPKLALLLTVPPMMWAGNAIVGRMLAANVPPMQLNTLRWLTAAIVLLPMAWRVLANAKRRAEICARWPALAVMGGLGVGAYSALQYLALRTSSPINVVLITSITPVLTMLLGVVLFDERPRLHQFAGACVSTLGVLTVLTRGDAAQLSELHFVPGDLWVLVACLCWATYSWLLSRPPASLSGARRPNWTWAEFLLIQILFGLVWSGLATGAEAFFGAQTPRWNSGVALALLFIGIGPAVIAYRC